MWGEDIVVIPFESAMEGPPGGLHGGRAHGRDHRDGATALRHFRGLSPGGQMTRRDGSVYRSQRLNSQPI